MRGFPRSKECKLESIDILKRCGSCHKVFTGEQDVLTDGKCWRLCTDGLLWFDCSCNSTLVLQRGNFDWYSPEKTMTPHARDLFNSFPMLKSLPNIPTALMELQTLIQSENVTSKQLAVLVKKEPVVAANILTVANHFKCADRAGTIDSLDHAISYIGRTSMRDIITTAAIQSFSTKCLSFDIGRFWEEAFLAGRIAERLARDFCSHIIPDEAYIAGCLSNIGKVVTALSLPEVADTITNYEQAPSSPRTWIRGEEEFQAPSHGTLGEIASSVWGMPKFVAEASAHHHTMPMRGGLQTVNFGELTGFSNQLAHWINLDPAKIDRKLMMGLSLKFGFSTERMLEEYVDKIFYLREASN